MLAGIDPAVRFDDLLEREDLVDHRLVAAPLDDRPHRLLKRPRQLRLEGERAVPEASSR